MVVEIQTKEELESIWTAWKIKYLLGDDKCEFDEELGKLLLEMRNNEKA